MGQGSGWVGPKVTALISITAALFAGCSSDSDDSNVGAGDGSAGTGSTYDPGVPWDDDSARLKHCDFVPAPAQETRPAQEPGAVTAGYATAILELPLGTPMGGYGNRVMALGAAGKIDNRARRWATIMVPSAGIHDAPRVDALAIDAAGESVVIVGIDTALLGENLLYDVENFLAPDGSMRGRILVSASHGHATYGGWQPNNALMAGYDRPRQEIYQRVVEAVAGVSERALAAMQPAKLGFTVDMDFDPDDSVNRDRRGENDDVLAPDGDDAGKDKDPMVWALRVDKTDGTPLAAIINIPLHGTIGDGENPLVSNGIPGAIERSLTAELGYPVMHLQGSTGDVSPAGHGGLDNCPNAERCYDIPRIETLAAHVKDVTAPMIRDIETVDAWNLEVVTRSFHIGKSNVVERADGTKLSYPPYQEDGMPDREIFDGSGKMIPLFDEFNIYGGAGLCGEGPAIGKIPGVEGLEPYDTCWDAYRGKGFLFALYDLPLDTAMPFCETVRTTVTALRLTPEGDDSYLIVTLPGESTAPLTAYLRNRSPAPPERTLVVGYGQDHAGYLLTAEDWLAGGYEPSVNLWGPLEGEAVVDGALEALAIAATPELEDPEAGTSRFEDYQFPAATPVLAVVTNNAGVVAGVFPELFLPESMQQPAGAQPAGTIERAVGIARFVWSGGDPAVDFPVVSIEREESSGQFRLLADASGSKATSAYGAVVITYTPDPINADDPTSHFYVASWQPVPATLFDYANPSGPFSLPPGRYRFTVKGSIQTSSGAKSYSVESQPFSVIAADLDEATASVDGATVNLVARLGNAPGLRALRDGGSDLAVPLAGPWEVTVNSSGGSERFEVNPNVDGTAALDLADAAAAAAVVSVDVRDPAGNGGLILIPLNP